MEKKEQRLTKNYGDFINSLHGKSIREYYNLDFPIDFELIKNEPMNHTFIIKHIRLYDTLIQLQLPIEIIKYIKQYVEIGLILYININYTYDHPFKAPKWNIEKIKQKNINTLQIWKNMVHQHNVQYVYDWSPSITIEKDLLYFIEKIMYKLSR